MPTVSVERDLLFAALEQSYTDEEFDRLCFDFGIELDDVVTEKKMKRKQSGEEGEEDVVVYKIDVPANRYDLLCLEGLSIALRVFLKKQDTPAYRLVRPSGELLTMTVQPETKAIRPYIVCAVLRGLKLDHTRYNSFLDLQDKLHFNICRRRTLTAIGTHDLDTLQPPFTYEARRPEDISFVPLAQEREFTAKELMAFYRDPANVDCKHLAPYTDIIHDSPVYPAIYDSAGTLLSLPPIINGNHSKIGESTKNCFIECTATDIMKAETVLNTIVCMFSLYCEEPFTVEPVRVVYAESPGRVDAGVHEYPKLTPRSMTCALESINRIAGLSLDEARVCDLLTRMELSAKPAGEGKVEIMVPPLRSDILHECDVTEDVAIAFGYNNIPMIMPSAATAGEQQPVNKLTDLLRQEAAMAGFTEALTLGLCSEEENYGMMQREDDGSAVRLENPKTREYQLARTSMLPGILKTVRENRARAVADGLRLFEISDVVLKDEANHVGARNERHFCALYMGPTAGFEIIHGFVDRVMQLLEVLPAPEYGGRPQEDKTVYRIEPSDQGTFFEDRCASVVIRTPKGEETTVGTFGVIHPAVLGNFGITFPCSAVELNIEPFV